MRENFKKVRERSYLGLPMCIYHKPAVFYKLLLLLSIADGVLDFMHWGRMHTLYVTVDSRYCGTESLCCTMSPFVAELPLKGYGSVKDAYILRRTHAEPSHPHPAAPTGKKISL